MMSYKARLNIFILKNCQFVAKLAIKNTPKPKNLKKEPHEIKTRLSKNKITEYQRSRQFLANKTLINYG